MLSCRLLNKNVSALISCARGMSAHFCGRNGGSIEANTREKEGARRSGRVNWSDELMTFGLLDDVSALSGLTAGSARVDA